MEYIQAIIVEDEKMTLESLVLKLQANCPFVQVIDKALTSKRAIESIQSLKPDLVFLDIQLDQMTGFDVLKQVQHVNFEVIFTTSYEEYAIEAIRANAIDYLLKPIDGMELLAAVNKAHKNIQERSKPLSRIALPVMHGLQFTSVDEIIYCEGQSNKTEVHLFNGKTFTVVKTLKEMEFTLSRYNFCRIHRSYFINLDYIESFTRVDGGSVTMSNGDKLPVSRNRKDAFLSVVSSGFHNRG
ncbi:MAG: LytTR family DNA-binding domain-containing protein [Bacteroidota bacterium]